MGLFDWLFRPAKSLKILEDEIWLTAKAKLTGAIRKVETHLNEKDRLLLVAHFPETLTAVCEQLRQAGIAFERHDHKWDVHDVSNFTQQQTTLPIVTLAESLPHSPPNDQKQYLLDKKPSPSLDKRAPRFTIIVIERHLLSSYDDQITHFAQDLPCLGRLQFLLSLEDPLLRIFAGEKVPKILGNLGMQKDESIKSRMVGLRMRSAQKKVAEKMQMRSFDSTPPQTAEEWLEHLGLENPE